MSPRILLPLTVLATACTTLGPMPTTTGVSAIPNGRPGVEIQVGAMPSTYLSDAARNDPSSSGEPTRQLSAVLEPARWLGVKGLIVGARTWGDEGDSPVEPMVGLRRKLDDTFAIAGIVYGTQARGEEAGASYKANRLGGELAFDAKLIPFGGTVELHAQGSLSATYLDANGTYCIREDGNASDCDDSDQRVDATVEGVYAAATGGFSLDIARRPHGLIHNIRLAFLASIGARPRIREGIQQESNDHFKSFGLSLTLGLGED
jgi:hypothetical protein